MEIKTAEREGNVISENERLNRNFALLKSSVLSSLDVLRCSLEVSGALDSSLRAE